jgi:hypothetical protein
VKEGWKLQRITVGKHGRGRIKVCERNIKTGLNKKKVFSTRIRINWLKIYDMILCKWF